MTVNDFIEKYKADRLTVSELVARAVEENLEGVIGEVAQEAYAVMLQFQVLLVDAVINDHKEAV